MERASWSYELPPAGESDVGVEQYEVLLPSGEHGKATTVVRHGDETYLVVAPSGLAVTRRLLAVPVGDVAAVDHESLTVQVSTLERAVELDPDRAVEDERADARRVRELPPELTRPQRTGDVAGPSDRLPLFLGLGAGAVGLIALLGAIAVIAEAETPWRFALLVVPLFLLAVALALSFAAWKRPYVASRAPTDGGRR